MPFSMQDVVGAAWPRFTIVDVGAMEIQGEKPPYAPLLKPGRFDLIGFEAVKAECDKLNALGQAGHRYINCIVGDGKPMKFMQTNYSMTSSVYEPNTPVISLFNNLAELMVPVSTAEVQTTRLDDVPELRDVRIDMLKIDIQGGEAVVFGGASRLLRECLVIHTEVEFVPLYKGQPLYGDVARVLTQAGFLHHTFLTMSGRAFKPIVANQNINAPVRQNLWSDVLFVRDFTRLAELSPEQLLKMAIMLHDMYGSVDLAQLCLAHHDRKTGSKYWEEYLRRLIGHLPPDLQKPV